MSVAQDRAWRIGRELDNAGPEASSLTLLDLEHGADVLAIATSDVHWTGMHATGGAGSMRRGGGLVRAELQRRLVAHGATDARFGDTIYRVTEPREWRVLSFEKLWEFLTMASLSTDTHAGTLLGRLFAANTIRVTGLDSIADTIDFSREVLRDTVVEYGLKRDRHGDPKEAVLQVVPIDRAPKWLQAFDEGEMR